MIWAFLAIVDNPDDYAIRFEKDQISVCEITHLEAIGATIIDINAEREKR